MFLSLVGTVEFKLFVGSLNKQATEKEVEQVRFKFMYVQIVLELNFGFFLMLCYYFFTPRDKYIVLFFYPCFIIRY